RLHDPIPRFGPELIAEKDVLAVAILQERRLPFQIDHRIARSLERAEASGMPGLASGISRDIRDGSLKKYLLQPLDMIGYLVSYRAAHKAAYIATSALPYAGLFFVCRGY